MNDYMKKKEYMIDYFTDTEIPMEESCYIRISKDFEFFTTESFRDGIIGYIKHLKEQRKPPLYDIDIIAIKDSVPSKE
jgi:hypothetical protein